MSGTSRICDVCHRPIVFGQPDHIHESSYARAEYKSYESLGIGPLDTPSRDDDTAEMNMDEFSTVKTDQKNHTQECICDPGYSICMYSKDGKCLAYGGERYEPADTEQTTEQIPVIDVSSDYAEPISKIDPQPSQLFTISFDSEGNSYRTRVDPVDIIDKEPYVEPGIGETSETVGTYSAGCGCDCESGNVINLESVPVVETYEQAGYDIIVMGGNGWEFSHQTTDGMVVMRKPKMDRHEVTTRLTESGIMIAHPKDKSPFSKPEREEADKDVMARLTTPDHMNHISVVDWLYERPGFAGLFCGMVIMAAVWVLFSL